MLYANVSRGTYPWNFTLPTGINRYRHLSGCIFPYRQTSLVEKRLRGIFLIDYVESLGVINFRLRHSNVHRLLWTCSWDVFSVSPPLLSLCDRSARVYPLNTLSQWIAHVSSSRTFRVHIERDFSLFKPLPPWKRKKMDIVFRLP